MTLVQAAGLARLQEEKLHDPRMSLQSRPMNPSPSPPPVISSPRLSPLQPLLSSPSRPSQAPIVRCLTPEELASRRKRGLCFSCDEKFHRGHRYAPRVHLLIVEDDDPPDPDPSKIDGTNSAPVPPDGPDPYPAQIIFNSLLGHVAPETLRLVVTLARHAILLLIDGGSTHNFIQQAFVTQLGLPCRATTPLRVMVGNGQHLDCSYLCKAVTIDIQATLFTMDLHV